jgi:hypothetical protein
MQQLNNIAGNNKRYYSALIICSVFLLIPAFYNHYPLVNPDTATHLASGFKPETPMDRPITYGLFARLFSLNGFSMWLLVFAQAYLVSWLIFQLIKRLTGTGSYVLQASGVVIFLSLFTSLSWFVSQVQPDVFTSAGFLCVTLVLMNGDGKKQDWLLYTIFLVAVAMHMSHPLLFCGSLACLLILKPLYQPGKIFGATAKKIMMLIALSLISMVVMGPALSKSKHVFFTGSLLEKGVLKAYLDDSCANKHYKICAYKDALPRSLDDFIWNDSSPLYKIGSWKGTKEEFNQIGHDVLTTPKYLELYFTATMRQAALQAVSFDVGEGHFRFPTGSNVNGRLVEYFPREVTSFNNSKQNQSALAGFITAANSVYTVVVILSLLVLVYMLARWKRVPPAMRLLVVVTVTGIIVNCLDCAAFSVTIGRYGAKMIWLAPFCAITFIMLKIRPAHS